MKCGWLTIGAILAICVACSPQSVAPTEGPVLDAASDVGELVDESDGGVTDAVAEVAVDAATDSLTDTITADAPDILPDTKLDIDAAKWPLLDADPATLGMINTPACSNQEMIVQPYALPIPPSATEPCPPPYASTCGTCPWIQTPHTVIPRFQARGIWTGEEFLLFGGALSYDFDVSYPWTMERWNPKKDKGFSLIDPKTMPFSLQGAFGFYPPWTRAFWLNNEAIVLVSGHSFRFNPKTNVFTMLPPIATVGGSAKVVAGKIFWWGQNGTKPESLISIYDPEVGSWTFVPFPSQFLDPTVFTLNGSPEWGTRPRNVTVAGDDVYVISPAVGYAPSAGLDAKKPLILRLNVSSLTWSMLPQAPILFESLDSVHLFGSFPGGIALIAPKQNLIDLVQIGLIWWKNDNKWTLLKDLPFGAGGLPQDVSGDIWTGSRFIVEDLTRIGSPFDAEVVGEQPSWPLLYDPYTDTWTDTTGVGAPKHALNSSAVVYTGSELFQFAGWDGVGVNVIHSDGVRLYLPNSVTNTEVLP